MEDFLIEAFFSATVDAFFSAAVDAFFSAMITNEFERPAYMSHEADGLDQKQAERRIDRK